MNKTCKICKQELPEENFYRDGRYPNTLCSYCKTCHKKKTKGYLEKYKDKKRATSRRYYERNRDRLLASQAAYRKHNPSIVKETAHRSHLMKKYHLSKEDFSALLESQGGVCKICKTNNPGWHGRFCVDHNHETGNIRGLLCNNCNVILGHSKDDTEILESAIAYLMEDRG